MKLFSEKLPFLRGNLHTHTTCSDGVVSPAESMRRYRALGYDFLAITDHRKLTVPEKGEIPEGLVWLPGTELDYTLDSQVCHLVGIGVTEEIAALYNKAEPPQKGIDEIHACGGLAILAHPAWSLNTTEFMLGLRDVDAVEIWNSVSMSPYNADRGESGALLDPVFTRGRLLPCLASDDTHFYGEEIGRGWTMVQAEERTPQAMMDAVRKGRLYATQGPEIRQISCDEGEIRIECSPCDKVIFYSNRPWSKGRAILSEGQTEAVWKVLPGETFVRAELTDRMGRKAWTTPLPVGC